MDNKLLVLEKLMAHKRFLSHYMNLILGDLFKRSLVHDVSKLGDSELPYFSQVIKGLNDSEFGSAAYEQNLELLKQALNAHYRDNDHHPEHFTGGIRDMSLIQLMEMFVDWMAAVKIHSGVDEDIYKSIEVCKIKFKYGEELEQIFKNTVKHIWNLEIDK